MDFTFEMNLDRSFVERKGYEILDILSDIGGIQGILYSFFAIILSFLNYKNFDIYMASRLFKIKKPASEEDEFMTYFERSDYFNVNKIGNLRQYAMDILPARLVCCKRTRKERGIQLAQDAMDREIDIIELIKSQRYFKLVIKHLLSPEMRMKIKERSRYIRIDPDETVE